MTQRTSKERLEMLKRIGAACQRVAKTSLKGKAATKAVMDEIFKRGNYHDVSRNSTATKSDTKNSPGNFIMNEKIIAKWDEIKNIGEITELRRCSHFHMQTEQTLLKEWLKASTSKEVLGKIVNNPNDIYDEAFTHEVYADQGCSHGGLNLYEVKLLHALITILGPDMFMNSAIFTRFLKILAMFKLNETIGINTQRSLNYILHPEININCNAQELEKICKQLNIPKTDDCLLKYCNQLNLQDIDCIHPANQNQIFWILLRETFLEAELLLTGDSLKYKQERRIQHEKQKAEMENLEKRKEEIFANVLKSGTFTDSRDGHIYKVAEINGQIWMTENFAYDSHGSSVYTWDDAQYLIPEGWRLPTDDDWFNLDASTDGCEFLRTHFGNDKGPSFWSATEYDKYDTEAVCFEINKGKIYYANLPKDEKLAVRYVLDL